jgi:hypothetical protein
VHQPDQQIHQRIGDLRRSHPAQRRQQGKPHRPRRSPQIRSVDVERLSAAMGVDLLGEGCLESPPLLSGFLQGLALGDGDVLAGEQQWCGQVVPEGVSGEVGEVERIPVDVAADSAAPEEGRTWIGSGSELYAIAGFDPHGTPVEHGALAGVREILQDGVLFGGVDLNGEVRQLVAGETFRQQATHASARRDRRNGPPALRAAVCGEDFVE